MNTKFLGTAAKAIACAAVALVCTAQAGSLKWTKGTYVDKVMSKAKKAGKPVFMIGGREDCINTTTTRDQSCENASVRAALGDYFLWFCNCDEQRDDFWYYATPYSDPDNGIMLPLCAVINPNKPDVCAAATSGRQGPSDLLSLLDKAEKKLYKTVTLNANGGTAAKSKVKALVNGKVGTLPKATRKGYRLSGWFTAKSGGTQVTDATKVKKDVTFYAQWKRNKYTIKFHRNGGTGSMGSITASYGKTVKLPANAFKKSGYKFKGWATKKGGTVAYKNKAEVKNLTYKNGETVTLYAVWKK